MAVEQLIDRLRELAQRTAETPLYNPVFQLSHEISRRIEDGEIGLDDVSGWIDELYAESLDARAARLARLLDEPSEKSALPPDFTDFKRLWENPALHAVFTAHPTFLLSPGEYEQIALTALGQTPDRKNPAPKPEITLAYEHGRAMTAMANAQDARDRIVAGLCRQAQETWPASWSDFAPLPFRFATWVGYDMDGRTDIKWHTSIGFRLKEKALRLARYVAALEAIDTGHALLESLRPAAAYAAERAEDFAQDLSDPAALSTVANRLTADNPAKLLSLAPLISALEDEAASGSGNAIALKTLAAAMRADGLGMGWIHFRVNAKQLHNALRQHLDETEGFDIASKSALATLARMVERVEPLRANFAGLAIESSTAVRQFLAMAQILKHIDGDSPIRMLIAECEQPATVLAALYFARLFGIEDKVDISPLFETEEALEHGGRLLDALLGEEVYRAYARRRGRIAIQTGFSDAGRFVGQIPASLAIERLQGRLAAAMAANGLGDVAALVFDTHGESMGRGAHPASFTDRLTWPLSDWARGRFAAAGIRLEAEASFQGGDGYVWFETPEMAYRTLSRIAADAGRLADGRDDIFYERTDLSLDFYRAIKEHQRDYLHSRTYARAITAFGLGLLNTTGSRKSRRQSDLSADRDMNLRQIRAIPHNAILQQLGYPVNVIAGIGSAVTGQVEDMAALLAESGRGRQIMRLARAANALASIKTVAAYGELFNSAYWASRPYRGTEDHIAPACEALADYLTQDDRAGTFRRLASRLRVDALKFHSLLELLPADETPVPDREQTRRVIGVLQALRLALFMHMLVRAVSVPAFSRANDISRHDVVEMIFSLRIDDALKQLRRAFPTHFPGLDDFAMAETADYPEPGGQGYLAIHTHYIDPIERAYRLSLKISTAIANQFGAHG